MQWSQFIAKPLVLSNSVCQKYFFTYECNL